VNLDQAILKTSMPPGGMMVFLVTTWPCPTIVICNRRLPAMAKHMVLVRQPRRTTIVMDVTVVASLGAVSMKLLPVLVSRLTIASSLNSGDCLNSHLIDEIRMY
jgi:hypothetical protein